MRRPREPNPTLAAEFRTKRRSVSQIPADFLATDFDAPAAFTFANPALANLQKKRARASLAHPVFIRTEDLNRKPLDPSLRLPISRKPRRPNLQRLSQRIARAPAPPRIHQQIPEPPRAAPIAQSKPQKPNLIPPPHRQRAESLVERHHSS